MNESTPLTRLKDLRARALLTDQMSFRDPARAGHLVLERREALQINDEMEAFVEGLLTEQRALVSRAFELAVVTTRSTNGHSWIKDLPPKANPSEFYQKLRALVRYLRDRNLEPPN